MLGEGFSNGSACLFGTEEGSDCKQEGFLNLRREMIKGAVELFQACVRPYKIEYFLGLFRDGLDIIRLFTSVTLTNSLSSDSASNVR